MTLTQLLEQRGVPVAGPGHKHYRAGWTHLCCPHCHDQGYHLGFPEDHGGGRCFKCGRHGLAETLRLLLSCPVSEAIRLAVSVVAVGVKVEQQAESNPELLPELSAQTLSDKGAEPTERHFAFLAMRNFLQKHIEPWELQFDRYDIIIPVHDANGRLVSWQARDITGKARSKYRSCPETEVKQLLYGLHHVPEERHAIIVVEGPSDAWRIGAGYAVATFGMEWTENQLLSLSRRFKEVYILFDNEPLAQTNAQRLHDALEALGVDAFVCGWVWLAFPNCKDPGELTDAQAEQLRDVLFKENQD